MSEFSHSLPYRPKQWVVCSPTDSSKDIPLNISSARMRGILGKYALLSSCFETSLKDCQGAQGRIGGKARGPEQGSSGGLSPLVGAWLSPLILQGAPWLILYRASCKAKNKRNYHVHASCSTGLRRGDGIFIVVEVFTGTARESQGKPRAVNCFAQLQKTGSYHDKQPCLNSWRLISEEGL